MKRINSSDSFGALISMCPTEEGGAQEQVYTREYQTMMEGCVDEEGHVAEKKRRLSVEQVKALERNFEVENKLEPERKVKLAQELGLQPRQVAVWFQNRRARWKTKQLERDYGVLKANYDALQLNYDSLLHDNQALLLEIKELKSKLEDEKTETNLPIKEETLASESDQNPIEMINEPDSLALESQQENFNFKGEKNEPNSPVLFTEYKLDGPSDSSDSSAILNDDQSPNASNSSSGVLQNHQLLFNSSSSSSPPSINGFSFNDLRSDGLGGGDQNNNVYHHTTQFVKMEEHNFFGGDEACNFFSEEPAPTLSWYNTDQWT